MGPAQKGAKWARGIWAQAQKSPGLFRSMGDIITHSPLSVLYACLSVCLCVCLFVCACLHVCLSVGSLSVGHLEVCREACRLLADFSSDPVVPAWIALRISSECRTTYEFLQNAFKNFFRMQKALRGTKYSRGTEFKV